jgi:hypothetical protein
MFVSTLFNSTTIILKTNSKIMDDQRKASIAKSPTKKVQRVCILDVDTNYTLDVTHGHALKKPVATADVSNTTSTSYVAEQHNGEENNSTQFYPHDVDDVLKALDPSISIETCYLRPNPRQSVAMIRRKQCDTDLFINLYDLADETGLKVVEYMQNQGLAFTGAGSKFYDPTRMDLKIVCGYNEINTPPFSFLFDLKTIERVPSELGGFPLFVKPEHGYDSVGINEKSVVHNMDELKICVENVLEEFGGALVERYIDGREFSVLVAGSKSSKTETFAPVEYRFAMNRQPGNTNSTGPAFITFEDKWGLDCNSKEKWYVLDEKENGLKQELIDIAAKLYEGFNGEGLARFDIRQEAKTKTLYVLDMNPNPSLFYKDNNCTADTIVHLAGWSKTEFLQFLINYALQRQKRFHSVHGYIIKRSELKGLGLYAVRDLKKGDLIYSDEEQPVRLATLQYVTENWNEREMRSFHTYAWPLSADIYAIGDLDPSNWKPLNHSCDPNMMINGLQYIARRDIAYDEELTMDYATYDPTHSFSSCWCGAVECRKTIQPNEYREEWFQKRYGTYVSPHVRTLIEIDKIKKTT